MPRPPSGEIFSATCSLYLCAVLGCSVWDIWFINIFIHTQVVHGGLSQCKDDDL